MGSGARGSCRARIIDGFRCRSFQIAPDPILSIFNGCLGPEVSSIKYQVLSIVSAADRSRSLQILPDPILSTFNGCLGPGAWGLKYQVSSVRYQVSGIKYQVSSIKKGVGGMRRSLLNPPRGWSPSLRTGVSNQGLKPPRTGPWLQP